MSHYLQWQDIEKQQLSIFIRDLSDSLQINLKHLIEDSLKETKPIKTSTKPLKKKILLFKNKQN